MNLSTAMSYDIMQMMARYMSTYNVSTQTLAADANKENIQTTGLGIAIFDGVPFRLPADAALDISAESNESVTAWATATTYTMSHATPVIRKNDGAEDVNVRFRLLATHTSNADSEPLIGSRWEDYWTREPHDVATAAAGLIGFGNTREYLVLANRAGTLSTALCGDDANSTTGFTLKYPRFDPFTYCPVGFVHWINVHTSGNSTIGTTAYDATNQTTTFHQLTQPIFPHVDNLRPRKV